MIYTIVIIDHTARAGKLRWVSQKLSGTSFKSFLLAVLVTVHIQTCRLANYTHS